MNKISAIVWFFIILLGLSFVGTAHFGAAQTATSVVGQVNSNLTWTKANSPYALVGPLTVNDGATLTIEPGVTVYINSYQFTIDGVLIAIGTGSDPIKLNDGQLYIGGNNSIIENAVITSNTVISNNPVGSATIINSNLGPVSVNAGSGLIYNCTIASVDIEGGSPLISNNNITGGVIANLGTLQYYPTIANNNLVSSGIGCTGFANISDNVISGCKSGLNLGTYVSGEPASPLIQRNLIVNNTNGININIVGNENAKVDVLNNTIENNTIGINLYDSTYQSTYTFLNNNLQNNNIWNLYLENLHSKTAVNATYNWWGKTTTQQINQTIMYVGASNSEMLSFVPFLTAPNPEALPKPNVPSLNLTIPASTSPSPTAEPTQTPTITQSTSPTPTSSPISPAPSTSSSSTPSAALSPSPSISSQSSASSQLGFYEVIAGLIAVIVVLAAVIVALLVKIRRVTHR